MKKLTKLTIALALALGLLVLPSALETNAALEVTTVSTLSDPGGGTP
jgi:hypothetical protein